jgi:hypothetical protein
MQALLRNEQERNWILGCVLRIYTPEDYLSRWRQMFAERMGFDILPDGKQAISREGNPTRSREAFGQYLRERGVSRSQLAEELGLSPGLVSRHMSGIWSWTTAWRGRLQQWISGAGSDIRGRKK